MVKITVPLWYWRALKCQTLGAAVHVIVLVAMCILFCSCLCTVCSKVSDSLMLCAFCLTLCLPCTFCLVSCLYKVRSRVSDTLSQALCKLSLANFPRWFHSIWFHCSHTFHNFLLQSTLCYSFGSKDMITAFTCLSSYRYSSVTLQSYLCWGHTYCQWPLIELAKNVSPKNKWPLATWSRFIRMCVFRRLKNGQLIK